MNSESSLDDVNDEDFSEYLPSHPYQLAEADLLRARQSKKPRGRQKHVPQWTRVISVNDDKMDNLRTFAIPTDQQVSSSIARPVV